MDAPSVDVLWEIAASMLGFLSVVAFVLLGVSILRSL